MTPGAHLHQRICELTVFLRPVGGMGHLQAVALLAVQIHVMTAPAYRIAPFPHPLTMSRLIVWRVGHWNAMTLPAHLSGRRRLPLVTNAPMTHHAVNKSPQVKTCLLYTSDAADDLTRV